MSDLPSVPQHLDPQAWLAAIVESSDDAIISKSLQGIVTSWNRGAQRLFGYTAEEMIGAPMTTVFPADRYDEEPKILARLARGERVDHFETVRQRKNGEQFEVSVTISPIRDATGKIIGASKIARDITFQKRAEQELRAARDAAETARKQAVAAQEASDAANRAKDHFLSVLSHELRTPLTPVLAAVSLMEMSPTLSREELTGFLEMIRRNVETEARLVDDLLDVTRINQGKIELHREALDVHATVRSVIAMVANDVDAKALNVVLALDAGEHTVSVDPGRFQQILLNLLTNAIKFTPRDGSITVRTFNLGGPADRIGIEITDTGIGIDAETLPRLFRPFEQGEKTITRKFGGLGLGLSIVQSLVHLHGGEVTARSEGVDRGATFTLTLATAVPTNSAGEVGQGGKGATPPILLGYRVLLVEDHTDTRRMMSGLLGSLGCIVTAVGSVHEAVKLADEHAFDLLVSDIGLPDGSGLEIMRYLQGRQQIPGIAISGFGQDRDLQNSREAGFNRHLVKPVSLQVLQDVILSVR